MATRVEVDPDNGCPKCFFPVEKLFRPREIFSSGHVVSVLSATLVTTGRGSVLARRWLLQTKFRRHIILTNGWDNYTSGYEKLTSAIPEFYFRFQFRPCHLHRHVILHQPSKFHRNWTTRSGVMTTYQVLRPSMTAYSPVNLRRLWFDLFCPWMTLNSLLCWCAVKKLLTPHLIFSLVMFPTVGEGAISIAFVCPSVCLSVSLSVHLSVRPSRTYRITREPEGLACPNSECRFPTSDATSVLLSRSKGQRSRSPGPLMLTIG